VVCIWQGHLESHLASLEKVLKAHQATENLASKFVTTPSSETETASKQGLHHVLHPDLKLGVGEQAEVASMLQEMRRLREVNSDGQLVQVYYCLGLLHTLIRDHHKVSSHIMFFLSESSQ